MKTLNHVVWTTIDSPIGRLLLTARDGALTGLYVADHDGAPELGDDCARDDAAFAEVRQQLEEYFAGERTTFDVKLDLTGTPFQVEVWNALLTVPYGETASYGDIARRIGRPQAVRAVGLANGRNPVSIIVPCHRVIGSNGSLTGYGWGVERKQVLLDLERSDGGKWRNPPLFTATSQGA